MRRGFPNFNNGAKPWPHACHSGIHEHGQIDADRRRTVGEHIEQAFLTTECYIITTRLRMDSQIIEAVYVVTNSLEAVWKLDLHENGEIDADP